MPRSADDPVFALHRYFLWANRMREHFDEVLRRVKPGGLVFASEEFIESYLYMSYWYGGLYVVAEGWNALGLTDPEIDGLLATRTGRRIEGPRKERGEPAELVDETVLDVLKRYRNGAFHFQRDYFDNRFLEFMKLDQSASWARALNRAFGRYFLEWFKQPA